MISKIIASDKITAVEELLDKYEKIVIVTHVSPDGDAIGSSLGLYHYLSDSGNDVNVIVPNSFPDFLKWIPGAKDILDYEKYPEFAQKLINEAELIFCLDFNLPKRAYHLGPLIEAASAKKVMVDHHPEPADFCDVVISYPEISSTSELIFRLICRMGDFEVMSHESATAIYTGMMTDTGAFTYNSNNAEIYYIIGELLKKGINKDQIYSNVYHNYSEDRYRMLGYTLCEKMKIYPEYNSALIWLTNEEQSRYRVKKGDTEGFANLPLNIKGIIFSVFIREDNDFIKISFRSQGSFPSNKFAAQCYNGGGHLNASGGEFYGTMEEAIAIFENALPEFGDLLKKK
ncbi:phosphoesterase RecJ-like protein [Dysgonomonas sp. PFB1-18]|uniref:DHH family phosphoesterase n=1 Tax=unclassified Dysgonomonas TaxID=2630389 RepID=UPI0024743FB7|nr:MULTISPECIES: bifunctional oligoribonuclease/PAP phosphatase NrnA [unclassified Dysgonomonas]MDH6309775.1 phosphoesterase RecJ-like protein [Dysgonomonas sp. PF1-14]MDH6339217.1 phosphoesterase RecJ-like protein [Dysgonomonas sp. PF1-16]MDH6380716.1 phosphoesterase RecJ-like protein [Dysgonomonas sp. PFB1-18]MDH6398212.1 phosphoesterase RecJ-like protein [Dysgonomonas sp. PF1-23]